jgi:hypothetical protein
MRDREYARTRELPGGADPELTDDLAGRIGSAIRPQVQWPADLA